MRQYITAILIPCLLLNMHGCYSTEYINTNQIDSYYPEEVISIKTVDQKEFIIKKDVTLNDIHSDSTISFCTAYKLSNDTITLIKKEYVISYQEKYPDIREFRAITDTLTIPSNQISEISFQEINWITTYIFLFGLVLSLYFIFIALVDAGISR